MTKNSILFLLALNFTMLFPSVHAQDSTSSHVDGFWKDFFQGYPLPKPAFQLKSPGGPIFLDYSQYGEFQNLGQANYRYTITDPQGLREALGEGIFPNNDVLNDPGYVQMKNKGLLTGSYWKYVNSDDPQRAFYIWAQATEDPGVKMFFIAKILQKAGLMQQAVKAYYAAIVFCPHSFGWAADQSFTWYVAPAAMSAIHGLCRDYPELDCELQGDSFDLQNGDDKNLNKHIIKVDPGKIIRKSAEEKIKDIVPLNSLKIVETRGAGQVRLAKYSNGEWQMLVDGKPYYIKGISYWPTEIGLTPEKDPNALDRWMFTDKNKNGIIDAPYESWIDNNGQDGGHKPIGDFELLKEMGINTIRLFPPNHPTSKYDPTLLNKPLLRDMYKRFGIKAVVCDLLGAYTQGSGASWEKGTDYTDPQQRANMMEVIKDKVMDLKDEPFVLMWVLGNENNMASRYLGVNATRTNAAEHPEAYAKFINEVAEMIHKIDGNHPVAIGNLELGLIDYYRQYAPAVDILGVNSYRGSDGFGGLFIDIKNKLDKPVLVTEYGCDAYWEKKGPDEDKQLTYLRGNLRDLIYNMPGGPGVGNEIGGIIFEYLDEWWKAPKDPADHHSTADQGEFPFPDGYDHEEWLGIVGQGDGKDSPFKRHLRKSYYYFKSVLNTI